MKIFVYGDLGGHFEPFMESLERELDMQEDDSIPEGVVVIQVGDLVHRGPESERLVDWVDQIMKRCPGQWVQLVGNHEANHLGGPTFGFTSHGETVEFPLGYDAEKLVQKWWKSGQSHLAAAVSRSDGRGDVLITHAGLCRQTWAAIGEPLTAVDAARVLNRQDDIHAFAPGYLLSGYRADKPGPEGKLMPPGVAWASAAVEVYPSWDGRPSLFDQIPLRHLHAKRRQSIDLPGIVREQLDPPLPERLQHPPRDREVPLVVGKAEAQVRVDRVGSLVLQLIGAQLVDQADAPPLLPQIEQSAPAGRGDRFKRGGELRPAPGGAFAGTFVDYASDAWRSANCN